MLWQHPLAQRNVAAGMGMAAVCRAPVSGARIARGQRRQRRDLEVEATGGQRGQPYHPVGLSCVRRSFPSRVCMREGGGNTAEGEERISPQKGFGSGCLSFCDPSVGCCNLPAGAYETTGVLHGSGQAVLSMLPQPFAAESAVGRKGLRESSGQPSRTPCRAPETASRRASRKAAAQLSMLVGGARNPR